MTAATPWDASPAADAPLGSRQAPRAEPATRSETIGQSPLRVLVIDDDDVDRMAVRRGLTRAGVASTVDESASERDALARLASGTYDCIFLDYNLPGSDGLALLRAIRAAGHDAPIVMLTGQRDEQVAVDLMKAGAVDYLPKAALTPERLASSLRYAVDLARAEAGKRTAQDDLRRLYEEAERARTRTERLQQVTAQLAAVLPEDQVAQLFVSEVRDALDADTAWLALLSADGQELVSVADVGFEPDAIAQFSRVPIDAAMPSSGILAGGGGRWFSSKSELLSAYPELAGPMGSMRQEAVALLPVSLGDAVFGIMTLGFHEHRAFPPEDRSLATALAQQFAQAVERARLYEAERASRAEAQEANRAKSEFLARMSHDLRTPLNAIGGYAQLMEEGVYGATTEGQLQSLSRIRRAQQHLLILINDILSFARLEAGQVRLDVQDVVLQDVLGELRPLIEPQVAERKLRFELQPAAPGLRVRADRDRLMQILVNLLTNAVKFTEPGGVIDMTTEVTGTTVSVKVRDTGRGIPIDRLAAIFDPFVQAGESIAERQGVGLGLAISRELARMMQGELTVESTVGVGSTFTLRVGASA